jgi:hypothetical protein
MKFKMGDRIAYYYHSGRVTGKIIDPIGCGVLLPDFYKIHLDNQQSCIAHEKQLRRLKPKKSRYMWIPKDKASIPTNFPCNTWNSWQEWLQEDTHRSSNFWKVKLIK